MKTGPGVELELGGASVVDQRAGDVAGHQVRGELHALELQLQCRGQRSHQQGLGDAGHTLEQHVAAAQQRYHQAADDGVLTDDHLGDLVPQRQQRVSCGVRCRRRCGSGVLTGYGLSHDCATCLSMSSSAWARFTRSVSVAGGGPNSAWPTTVGILAGALHDGLRRWPRGRRWDRAPAGAGAAAGSQCAAHRRRGRRHGATGRAARGPRRSPMRARRPEVARRQADRSVGPSTARATARPGTAGRTIHITWRGMRSKIVAPPDDSPSLCCGAYQMTRGCVPARFIASAALPCFNRPELVMKSAVPTTVTVRPSRV